MMHTTTNSCNSIISIRTYSAFNDYSNERCPSNYCCCCCSFPINSCKLLVPTNPSYLYGLRQSTLIHWPPSRRLILGSSDRRFARPSIYDVGRCCFSQSCCVKQERLDRIISRSCIESCCVDKKEKSVDVNRIKNNVGRPRSNLRSNALGDAEAMLSLLTEGIVEECVVIREKKRSSFQEGKIGSKQNAVIGKFQDRKPNLDSGHRESEPKNPRLDSCRVPSRKEGRKREEERKDNPKDEDQKLRRESRGTQHVAIGKLKDRKQNVDYGYSEAELKNHRRESYRVPPREEDRKRVEERENHSKGDDRRLRRRESSSSYYSLTDSGDFESDAEVDVKQEQFLGESSVNQKTDLRKSGGILISEKTEKDQEMYRGEKEQVSRISTSNDFRFGGSVQRDWRKKSEKKLTEDFEETKSRNDSVARKAQLSQAQGNRSMIDSSSKKQFNFQEEQSTSDVKSFGQSSTHVVKDNRASIYSKSSSQHESQNSQEDVGTTSTTWRRSSQGKESKIIGQFQEAGCDYCETCGRSMEKKKIESDIQPRINPSETTIDAELTVRGDHLSESSRYRKHDAKSSNSHQSLAEEESRQHVQTHMVTGRASEKRKSQHYQESMSADDSCIQSKWTQQPEAGLHRLVEKSRTTAESQSGSRLQEEGKSSSSLQISAKQENKKHDRTYLATGQVDARRKSQHYSEIMDTDATYLQSTLRSQQQAETQKKQEERFSLTTEEVKRLRKESSGKITKDTESSEMSQSEIGDTRVDSSNLEINSQSASDKQVYNEQTYSKSKLKSIEEIIEKRKWVDETIVQSTFQTDVQGPSTVHFAEEATKTQPQFPSISQTGAQPLREEVKTGKLSATLPPYQHIKESTSSMRQDIGSATEVGSDSTTTHAQTGAQPLREEVKTGKLSATLPPYQHIKESTSSMRQDIGSTIEVGSDSTPTHAQVSRLPSYAEGNLDDVSKSDYTPEDTLLSAAHMQESSSRIVGDFVEKMSHEASTYETSVEKKSSKMDLKHQDKNNMLKRSTHLDSEDALVSAARMQESSSLIYGDFDEKMSQEALNSETIIDKKKSKNSTHQGGNYMLKGSTQFDSDKTASQKHVSDHSYEVSSPDLGELKLHKLDSKGSSGDSGTKEPSDQMWDVKDHFVQESSETEPLEDATSESILAARTGKSLWKTVTGALRLRWSSHSENQKSPVKRESSPSGSGSGETWFSENEGDQAKGNAMKAEEICLVQEASSNQSLLVSSRSQKEDVVAMSLDGQLRHADLGASPSSSVLQSSSPSGVATVGESVNLNISEQLSQPSALVNLSTPSRHLRRSSAFEVDDEAEKIEAPTSSSDEQRDSTLEVRQMEGSTSALVNLSTPSRHLRRSSAFEVDDEAEKIEAPTSSSDEQRDSTVEVRQMEGSTSAGTEVEMKGRKLQRSKLVLQRYDDWEDAYRLTREQRKVDEIFMREALSEAIKAAESWEVPVGAVLVQNGNIIARGCNLVEELRDSTAHAEMLCIREASNVLRTWRLSDTTLYVTLEPCPMCAGAILQARISTLVWGAPNKLLGADGSWIRLFPAGGEGEEHAEVTDMPAAPVHPFHPNMKVRRGILEDECADIMQQFFQLRRRKAKEKKGETSSEESDHQPSCFPRPHHRPRLLHKMHNVFHPSKKGAD